MWKRKIALIGPSSSSSWNEGLTLGEVLVALTVLGFVVAVLIVIINPLEHLHRTQDSNAKNVAIEYINACTRYYARHGEMPWLRIEPTAASFNEEIVKGYTQILISEGELKPEFQEALGKNASRAYLTAKISPPEVIVCFDPGSKALSADEETKYAIDGTLKTDCPDSGEECYWCVQQE